MVVFSTPARTTTKKLNPPPKVLTENMELAEYIPSLPEKVNFQVRFTKGGGFFIQYYTDSLAVHSYFSKPDGEWNVLTTDDSKSNWVKSIDQTGLTVIAGNNRFSLTRKITLLYNRLDIEDSYFNSTDSLLGLIIHHKAIIDTSKVDRLWLAGVERKKHFGGTTRSDNPTTFFTTRNIGIGILPVDDVLRTHIVNYAKNNRFGIEDRGFALPAGYRRTTRWSIYLVPDKDYYSFINAVRRDWNVNFTIQGGFVFMNTSSCEKAIQETPADFLSNRSVKFLCSLVPKYSNNTYAQGTGFYQVPVWHCVTKRCFQKFKSIQPDLQTLVYFHAFISTGKEAASEYDKNRMVSETGELQSYPYRYDMPLFVPTENNQYGAALENYFDIAFDSIDADGIYWDEMAYSKTPYTYNPQQWDSCSVLMDLYKHKIVKKRSHLSLLVQKFKIKKIKYILNRGKALVGNTHPATQSMMQFHFPRFVETAKLSYLSRAHLFSPIGLGDRLQPRTEQDIIEQIRQHLLHGCLYYYYRYDIPLSHPNLTRYMYPFTPIELHEGVLIGEERILAAKSGIFGWGDESEAEVHVFNSEGREVEASTFFQIFETEEGNVVRLELPPNGLAAIIRK